LGAAPYFFPVTNQKKNGEILSEACHENSFEGLEKGKGIKTSEWLIEKEVDTIYLSKAEGKGPGYVFSVAGVNVVEIASKNVEGIRLKFKKEADIQDHMP
jgi:predicted Fe-Mo cluster-binding NifX family protein